MYLMVVTAAATEQNTATTKHRTDHKTAVILLVLSCYAVQDLEWTALKITESNRTPVERIGLFYLFADKSD